jgi:hypothetical protein
MVSSLGWSKLFSMPQCAVCRFGFGTAPTRLPLGDAGLLTIDSIWRAGVPFIDELAELSIHRQTETTRAKCAARRGLEIAPETHFVARDES